MSSCSARFASLTYRQLQDECRKAGLTMSGNTAALRRRLRSHHNSKGNNNSSGGKAATSKRAKVAHGDDDDVGNIPAPKRQKKSASDDLLCPITLELPFDPVTAMDGRVYERTAIEKHFELNSVGNNMVKSPLTNKPMGKQILPAPQTKNLIETLIENGVITGDLKDKWIQKQEEKKKMDDLIQKAEDGDVKAMVRVAHGYRFSFDGFQEDARLAYKWFDRAHIAGSPIGAACMGDMLCHGVGTTENKDKGMMLLGMAAGQGSDWAAYTLGCYMMEGRTGNPVDKYEARRLFTLSLSDKATIKHMDEECEREAKQKLEELEKELADQPETSQAQAQAQAAN